MLVLEEKLLTKYKSQKGPTLVFAEGLSRLLYTCQRECSMVLATYPSSWICQPPYLRWYSCVFLRIKPKQSRWSFLCLLSSLFYRNSWKHSLSSLQLTLSSPQGASRLLGCCSLRSSLNQSSCLCSMTFKMYDHILNGTSIIMLVYHLFSHFNKLTGQTSFCCSHKFISCFSSMTLISTVRWKIVFFFNQLMCIYYHACR